MLVIRLLRKGRKNQPFFRIVVTNKKNPPRGGRIVEDLGYIDPLTKKRSLNRERILHWLSQGVKPSDTVYNLLVSEKIIEGKKINVLKLKKKEGATKEESSKAIPQESQKIPQESQMVQGNENKG